MNTKSVHLNFSLTLASSSPIEWSGFCNAIFVSDLSHVYVWGLLGDKIWAMGEILGLLLVKGFCEDCREGEETNK